MAETKYQRIWQNYATFKRQTSVMRSGFARMGIYPGTPDGKTEPQRSESVAEHVLGTLVLLDEIAMFCPELISEADTLRCMRILLKHEIGEIEIGDIPDDGRRNEARKLYDERRAMIRYCEKLPAQYGMPTLRNFTEFQDRHSELGRIAYCIDKGETVLQCVLYEQDGRDKDCLDAVLLEKLSEQDRKYMERTGSLRIVDNWSAHYLDLIRDFGCAPTFVGILRAAVEDVRGEWFAWCEE